MICCPGLLSQVRCLRNSGCFPKNVSIHPIESGTDIERLYHNEETTYWLFFQQMYVDQLREVLPQNVLSQFVPVPVEYMLATGHNVNLCGAAGGG